MLSVLVCLLVACRVYHVTRIDSNHMLPCFAMSWHVLRHLTTVPGWAMDNFEGTFLEVFKLDAPSIGHSDVCFEKVNCTGVSSPRCILEICLVLGLMYASVLMLASCQPFAKGNGLAHRLTAVAPTICHSLCHWLRLWSLWLQGHCFHFCFVTPLRRNHRIPNQEGWMLMKSQPWIQ